MAGQTTDTDAELIEPGKTIRRWSASKQDSMRCMQTACSRTALR